MNLMICDEVKQHIEGEHRASGAAGEHGGRRERPPRMWRHPSRPSIKVPYRVAATIAVMEMGISDYSIIANAVGLSVEEVERVDMVEEPAVRQLALAGIPTGESFKLSHRLRCPRCQAKVGLAPCIACHSY